MGLQMTPIGTQNVEYAPETGKFVGGSSRGTPARTSLLPAAPRSAFIRSAVRLQYSVKAMVFATAREPVVTIVESNGLPMEVSTVT